MTNVEKQDDCNLLTDLKLCEERVPGYLGLGDTGSVEQN
jgi:hypothetical protein